MGISCFFQVVRDKAPSAIEYLDGEEWKDKRLGVDAPVLLHRARAASSDAWTYLSYIVDQLRWLRTLGVKVLFVFDGDALLEKSVERQRRKTGRDTQAQEADKWAAKLETATEWEEIANCQSRVERCRRAAATVSDHERQWMQRILDSHGAPWCRAPHEAETFLAALQRQNMIDEIVTEDSDAIVAGAHSILRNFWSLRWSGAGADNGMARLPQRVRTEPLLRTFNLDAACMRTAAALAGCDFAPKLRNVGFIRALRVVATHRTDMATCLRGLKHPDVANVPDLLSAYTTAVLLLEAPALGSSELALVPVASLLEVDPAAAARLVEEAEALGEPWALRDAFEDKARKKRRVQLQSLVPNAWLLPYQATTDSFDPG